MTMSGMQPPTMVGTIQPATELMALSPVQMAVPARKPRGPRATKVSVAVTSISSTGLKKNFTMSGITRSKKPSMYFSAKTMSRTGMTLAL